MFDILFNAKKAERNPFQVMLLAIFYSSISILVGFWLFPEYGSLASVFLIVLSCLYFVQKAIKYEEEKDIYFEQINFFEKHKPILKMFLFFFVGVVISFSFWVFILPSSPNLFSFQKVIVDEIQGNATKNIFSLDSPFFIICKNNFRVFFISFLISLIYGAGAIFVLTWNASLMGYVIGMIIKNNGFFSFPLAFLKYFIHGLPEMLSYFIVILSGSLIYSGIIRGDLSNKKCIQKIILDVLLLIFAGALCVIFAALIEVYISPLI